MLPKKGFCNYTAYVLHDNNKRCISMCTLMSSSQTSDRNTNMASSFELSNWCNFVDAFTDVREGPPKKFILPKHDLEQHKNLQVSHAQHDM